ncbi:MAG: FAD-dependent monooxygenase [Betaproteobacteria bacterium]|nr:FAD-dependent monooxygenase [Betaproteobacteria bacterium]
MTHDVAIVGAGPVGATLALALADSDLDVVVVDPRAAGEAARTDRSLALSHGARLVFERLGVWAGLAATEGAVTPIVTIDVSQARGFGALTLDAGEQGLPALGYVVSYRALQCALDAALQSTQVAMRYGTAARSVAGSADAAKVEIDGGPGSALNARLAVVADGAGSTIEGIARTRRDYRQVALVAAIALSRPHEGVAYERFTPDGPVALLPERDHYALVWTQTPERAARLLDMPAAEFLAALAAHFGRRSGGFTGVAKRRSFPLVLEVATATTATRVAVIGNAAQALHPIAGQGFNLGLRDAWELAQTVLQSPRDDLGSAAMLDRHRRGRALDRRAGIAFTHGLVQLFGNNRPWLSVPRGIGLALLDAMPLAKRAFTRAMLFGIH